MTQVNKGVRQYGDPGRTRTPNLLIRSQLLYPVELRDRTLEILFEVVGVGLDMTLLLVNRLHFKRYAVPFSIGLRRFQAFKLHFNLAAHICRAGPAHERVDLASELWLKLENPLMRVRSARLHGILCRLVNACLHH